MKVKLMGEEWQRETSQNFSDKSLTLVDSILVSLLCYLCPKTPE